MARAAKTAVVGTKAIKSLNLGFYGEEPIYNRELTPRELDDATTWYNYNMDTKDGIKYLIEWMTNNSYDAEAIRAVRTGGEKFFPFTIFKLARILNVGGKIPGYAMEWLTEGIKTGCLKFHSDKSNVVVYKRPARLNEFNVEVMNGIEDAIDSRDKKFNVKTYLKGKGVDQKLALKIVAYYEEEMQKTKKFITTEPIDDLVSYVTKIIADIQAYAGLGENKPVIRAPRKPRRKKVIPPEKKVSKMKYLREHVELGVKSIDPRDIIGKKALWYIDTKYNKLVVVRSDTGLDVKGTTIIFDEKISESKRVGRRAKFAVDTITKGGKVAIRNIFKDFKTENIEVTGRINEYTILLKVEK